MKNLYIDKIKEQVDESMYEELYSSFTMEKQAQEKRLQEVRERISSLSDAANRKTPLINIIRQYADCTELTFEMVQLFIDRIVVKPRPKFSRQMNIEIYWKI